MFLAGSKEATLQQVRMVDIHGTRFYDIAYAHDDEPEQVYTARIGVEGMYSDPQPGDPIAVTYLMNVPTTITRR